MHHLELLHAEITQQEVLHAIQQARKGKSCGLGDIPVEVLGLLLVQQFLTCPAADCTIPVLKMGWYQVLEPWNTIKKTQVSTLIMTNYRGITLITHICKLYSAIINFRSVKWVKCNKILHDEQNGFLKEHSCQDQLQTFRSVIQTSHKE